MDEADHPGRERMSWGGGGSVSDGTAAAPMATKECAVTTAKEVQSFNFF